MTSGGCCTGRCQAVTSQFFETASAAERRQADLFLADLTGRSLDGSRAPFRPRARPKTSSGTEAIAALPGTTSARTRRPTAEEELDDERLKR